MLLLKGMLPKLLPITDWAFMSLVTKVASINPMGTTQTLPRRKYGGTLAVSRGASHGLAGRSRGLRRNHAHRHDGGRHGGRRRDDRGGAGNLSQGLCGQREVLVSPASRQKRRRVQRLQAQGC